MTLTGVNLTAVLPQTIPPPFGITGVMSSALLNPFEPKFRKNSFNLAGKLQLFRSVKLIETHRIMKITKKMKLYNIK